MLHAVIGLSKVHEGCTQRLLLESGPVNEVAQSNQLMLCGHTWPEARLARSSQASFLSPADNAAEDGSIQLAQRLISQAGCRDVVQFLSLSLMQDRIVTLFWQLADCLAEYIEKLVSPGGGCNQMAPCLRAQNQDTFTIPVTADDPSAQCLPQLMQCSTTNRGQQHAKPTALLQLE